MNETELRDRLSRAAGSLDVGEPPVQRLVARGNRKQFNRRVTAAITTVAVLAASSWALFSLRRLDPSKPADSSLPAVARFDMGGRPIRQVAVGHGAAWITVQDGANSMALARIDETTGQVTRVPAAGEAGYVVVGAGSVWTATCANPSNQSCTETRIVRIDPETLEAVAEIPVEGPIFRVTFGAGSLWVMTDQWPEAFLNRIDPASNSITSVVGDWVCCGETVFGEGTVWGLNSNGRLAGELVKLDPATEEVTQLPKLRPRFRFGAQQIAAGEGAVWASVGTRGGFPTDGLAIVKINPATGMVSDIRFNVGSGTFVAGEGALWIARAAEGERCVELLRLDPSDAGTDVVAVVVMGEDRYRIAGLGGRFIGVGVGGGAAWITIDQTYEVIRIELAALGSEPLVDPECRTSPSN